MDALLATAADPTTQMILGVIFCAVIVRAAFGFGDVLVSVPILTLFVGPRLVVPLMGLVGATNALLLLLAERQSVQWRPVRFLLLASVVGIPVGVGLLSWLAEDTINFGLGVVLIAFCIWSLSGRQAFRLAAPAWALPFGFCAGVMGGAVTAVTAPPITPAQNPNGSAQAGAASLNACRPERLQIQKAIKTTPSPKLMVSSASQLRRPTPTGIPTTEANSKKRTGRHWTDCRSARSNRSAFVAPTKPISGTTSRGPTKSVKMGTLTKTSPKPNAARTITAQKMTPRIICVVGSAAVARSASMNRPSTVPFSQADRS